MHTPDPQCPNCQQKLFPIRVLDKTGEASHHDDLEYARVDTQRSFWLGRYPVAGKINAFMCGTCGSVQFFASPARKDE